MRAGGQRNLRYYTYVFVHMNTHIVNKNIALYIALSLYCPVDDLGCKLTRLIISREIARRSR